MEITTIMGNFHTVSGLAAACGFTGSTKACIILNGKLDDSDQDIQVGALALKYSGGRVNPLVATIAHARPRPFLVRLVGGDGSEKV